MNPEIEKQRDELAEPYYKAAYPFLCDGNAFKQGFNAAEPIIRADERKKYLAAVEGRRTFRKLYRELRDKQVILQAANTALARGNDKVRADERRAVLESESAQGLVAIVEKAITVTGSTSIHEAYEANSALEAFEKLKAGEE